MSHCQNSLLLRQIIKSKKCLYAFHTQNLLHVTCACYMKLLQTYMYMSSGYLIGHYGVPLAQWEH